MSFPSDAFTGNVHPLVRDYMARLDGQADPLLDRLEAYALKRDFPLIGRESGRWLMLLASAIGARRVFEFGSGFGYSAAFFARAVGPEGEVHACEKDVWEKEAFEAEFDDPVLKKRICFHLGDAFSVIQSLPGQFDAVLIDCNKVDYLRALELAVPRLRTGGILLADNVLWGGKTSQVAQADDASTLALQAFNKALFSDPRLQAGILPVGDGLAMGLKH
jgi:predicted O-methyltransferase YrrM